MTRPADTFVDIDASSSRTDRETGSATALAIAADLTVGTIGIGPASWPATAIDTDLAGNAIVVAIADLDTVARQTSFASYASVGTFATSRVTPARLATHTSWTNISGLTVNWISHASLLSGRSTHESFRTGALSRSIDDTAQGVQSADSFALARALALMVQTGLIDGTVRIGTAAGFAVSADASLPVRALTVADTRQLAHAGHAAFTLSAIESIPADGLALAAHTGTSSWTIDVGAAVLRLTDTSAVGCWIRVESRRTGARRSVIDDTTGGIRPTKVVARIDASSIQTGGL